MLTLKGRSVWPKDAGRELEAPTLYDIGAGLGRIARFAGQIDKFYTVLAHTLTVAALLPDRYAIHGLLHDAPEAMCSDVPTPWKTSAAKEREVDLLYRIYADPAVNLAWPISAAAQDAVNKADQLALVAEATVLGYPAPVEKLYSKWPDHFSPEANAEAVALTEFHLENVFSMLDHQVAGPIFEEAFEHYKGLYDNALEAEANALGLTTRIE